jgi:hypothetical protein
MLGQLFMKNVDPFSKKVLTTFIKKTSTTFFNLPSIMGGLWGRITCLDRFWWG